MTERGGVLASSVLAEIERRVAGGFDSPGDLYFRIFETMGEELELGDEITRISQLEPSLVAELRGAIDRAFARKIEEMKSWPAQLDTDRLREAFDALNAQGIVALENCDSTQDDGLERAVELSISRDQLGRGSNDACCFFHEQDLRHALEGVGLWLTFSTFLVDRPGHAEQIGRAVVEACLRAGLKPVWNGSSGTRIRLAEFRWQRRLRLAGDAEIQSFLESWELELRAGYLRDVPIAELLEERAGGWFAEFANCGPALMQRLHAHTDRFLDEEKKRESAWSEATANDRISAAFADLAAKGVVVGENLGLTIQDGWVYAGGRASEESRGVVFFHHEDVIDAIGGQSMWLAFGARSNRDRAVRVAQAAMDEEPGPPDGGVEF